MTTVDRIEDTAGFEKLREEWNELLGASASNCLFLTWEWLYTWWKHHSASRSLFLLVVRCGQELTAIAPFVVRPRRLTHLLPFRSMEFLGVGSGADYLDVIIRRGRERQALQALAEHLADGKRMLELTHLKRGSCLAAELAVQMRQRGWSFSDTKTTISPFIRLSGHSWQSYLTTFGPEHFQGRLKNATKRFEVRFEQALSEEQRREAMELLITLHNMRWRDRGGSSAFHTPSLRAFHEELSQLALQHGWLRLFVLWLDGKPAASLYGFRYHRTFYFYQSGFDPDYRKHSVGFITVGLSIKSAIEEGTDEYDLLYGDEQYKFRWARDVRELGRLELYPPGAPGFLRKRAMGLHRATRRIARHVLPKPVADRLTSGKRIGGWGGPHAARSH